MRGGISALRAAAPALKPIAKKVGKAALTAADAFAVFDLGKSVVEGVAGLGNGGEDESVTEGVDQVEEEALAPVAEEAAPAPVLPDVPDVPDFEGEDFSAGIDAGLDALDAVDGAVDSVSESVGPLFDQPEPVGDLFGSAPASAVPAPEAPAVPELVDGLFDSVPGALDIAGAGAGAGAGVPFENGDLAGTGF